MTKTCCICTETFKKCPATAHSEKIHFFKTPAKKVKEWEEKLCKPNLKNLHFCSRHFERKYVHCFSSSGNEIYKLTHDAEPTLFLEETENDGDTATSRHLLEGSTTRPKQIGIPPPDKGSLKYWFKRIEVKTQKLTRDAISILFQQTESDRWKLQH